MIAPKAEKITSRIIDYANKDGRWQMPSFVYDMAQKISNNLINSSDIHSQIDGYFLRGITYFANGEHEDALTDFESLFDLELAPSVLSLYITILLTQGYLEKADIAYKKYYDTKTSDIPHASLFTNIILLHRMTLDLDRAKAYIQNYTNRDLPKRYIELMQENLIIIEEDLNNIAAANIDKALVQEVLSVATRTMGKLGKFRSTFRTFIHQPNDDLFISVYTDNIDFELMDELNESWLEAMINHESNYDFEEISRVLINFRPDPEGFADVV